MRIKVFLEGPFDSLTLQMKTDLNPKYIPGNQPYNQLPWNYSGSEYVSIFPENVCDWVLFEVHDTTQIENISSESLKFRKAALLNKEGSIVNSNDFSDVKFNDTINHSLYLFIRHRNHLDILSAIPLQYNMRLLPW